MKSKKTYIIAILLMFFLTLSCAYANEDPAAEDALLSADAVQVDLSSTIDGELAASEISSTDSSLSSSEIIDDTIESSEILSDFNYEDLIITDINFTGDSSILNIQGFSQNGLVMSDFVMTIVPSANSYNLNMKIPEVKYTDYNSTMFVFKNLDLNILPSSDPSALDLSAVMDRLDLITGQSYVNMEDLRLFFKSYPEVNGVSLALAISDFVYNSLEDTYLHFNDLDLNMALGLNGQAMNIKIILPNMNLLSGDDMIDMAGLDLGIVLPSLKLSDLDISILMSELQYTSRDGESTLNLTDMDLSLLPILNSTDFNSLIKMSSFCYSGINSSDLQFPGFNIYDLDFEDFTTGLDLSNVDLSGVVSILDVSSMDLSSLVSYLSSGFDIVTYTDNMPGQYTSSLDFNAIDLASIGLSDIDVSSIDMAEILKSGDYSSLSSSVLNLTQLFDAFDINASELGVDLSGYNLSSINISDIGSILSDPNFNMSALASKMNLTNLDLGGVDISGLIKSFNMTSFDLNSLLKMFNITGFNLSDFMNGFDLQKLLSLFMKNNTQDNKTVPDTPSYAPASYTPVKETYNYRTFTVTRLSDNLVICNARFFLLDYLNKLFNMTFINGHLKVYIDGKLVFEGDTTDDLTQVIFEIIEKYIGEHEVKVEFTDSENKTNTYTEKIIVE